MNNEGSVWLIESDPDDRDVVQQVWEELHLTNELHFFENGEEVMDRLDSIERAPFIIICELRLPKISGFDLRERMLATNSLKFKSVPFIFWTTQASDEQIIRAYDLSVHGFFIKEPGFKELKITFINILNYWLQCKMPPKKEKDQKS